MKKLLLAFAIFATMAFTGCDSVDKIASTYILTISPLTATAGETVTFTVVGVDADQHEWQACYESVTDSSNSGCWSYNSSSEWTYTVALDEGAYTIYASSKTGDLHTEKTVLTVLPSITTVD